MFQNLLRAVVILFCLSGCAERVIDITDKDGEVIGGCKAGFDWHFYGLQDSIDYMLYECAKDSIAKGFTISDDRLLTLDFTLPSPPEGELWNKKLAMHHFHKENITERELGYILAAIENEYQKVAWPAEDDLASGKITKTEFIKIIKEAKFKWLGE
ncbi:hypothetical protein [Psychrobium sp. 1_MG-2023]|uniref:hypothetical protein n=1 Tax=Psychrobium sp. 1_MG-2023 TaxID=3062624 RepID=UPI000C34A76E|nr:hypothetical protein [Psychrobium sp. 1_MG-2023]MDP2562336.1 hypothetical protein [Psychrobium sp. 1_MG-2023]PKF58054.1 hypothetical protein CW748_04440 [Alteromonadales bacterium alter-6D02]